MSLSPRTTIERPDLRAVLLVAIASACGFGTFYGLYTSAPVVLAGGGVSAGTRTGVFMACVIAVQPLVPLAGRWLRVRSRAVGGGLASMALGFALLPFVGGWPGLVLIGLGFGVFVVTSAAWVRELSDESNAGRSLGIYGLASAIGGTIAAPAALALTNAAGVAGVAVGGAVVVGLGVIPVEAARRIGEHGRRGLTDAPTDHVPTLPRSLGADVISEDPGPYGAAEPDDDDRSGDRPGDPSGTRSDDGTARTAATTPDETRVAAPADAVRAAAPDSPAPPPEHAPAPDGSTAAAQGSSAAPARDRSAATVIAPTLTVHVLAVIAYGLMLSSAGALTAGAAVAAAFSVQGAVAVGRPVAGWLSDRWSGVGTILGAAAVVAVALAWAVLDDDPVRFVVAATVVGAASGAVQTAALTLMMRRAHTPLRAEQVSMGWNVAFDVALGLAAALATRVALV